MAKKSAVKRIARLEDVCIGAGFLLQKLAARYGDQFGIGIGMQVSQCINDCNQIARAKSDREARQLKAAA